MRRAWLSIPVLGMLVLGLSVCGPPRVELHGTRLDPPKALPLGEFALVDYNRQDRALSELKGRWALVFFGYTHCPDICPLTLGKFRAVRQKLSEEQARRVQFVFITVDPERDTPERLGSYVPNFHPEFLGLTGSTDALKPVYEAFGVVAQRATSQEYSQQDSQSQASHPASHQGHKGYAVIHTTSIFLLNPKGELVGIYPQEVTPDELLDDLRRLLH